MKKKDCSAWGLFILRFVVGLSFIYHGLPKLLHASGTMGFFSSLSFFGIFQIPGFFAIIYGIIETVGGLWLILGWKIKWPSYTLAAAMFFAILVPLYNNLAAGKTPRFPELEILLFVIALTLAWTGPGKCSFDNMINKKAKN